jgi:hypothetical protein
LMSLPPVRHVTAFMCIRAQNTDHAGVGIPVVAADGR